MSWLQKLALTYDNSLGSMGYSDGSAKRPLLPICHSTTQAHIEIEIDLEGRFRLARTIQEKAESTTIHPATESSAGRSGSMPVNHPFCDKLQYVAGDFVDYGGVVTSGFAAAPEKPFNDYLATLEAWCGSPFGHPKARAVLNYVSKRSVMRDLVEYHILLVGEDGTLLSKDQALRTKDTRDIFSVVDPQGNAFVRWIVVGGDGDNRTWRDPAMWQSWINYYLSDQQEKSICYVTGEEARVTLNHPRNIRREGDGAKIISANDTTGFTFRGRFIEDAQVAGVGLEASQKAHSALTWLIGMQGYRKGDLAIVAWGTIDPPIVQPTEDTMFDIFGDEIEQDVYEAYTAEKVAKEFKKRIAGYGKKHEVDERVVVMALDSATPGRMAVTFYRELARSEYLQRVDEWHATCAWLHRYRGAKVSGKDGGKPKWRPIPFIGAPAPNDIAEAAYGTRLDDKLRAATIQRILPCIVDGQPIPRDLVESVVRRASNRTGLENYEWEKALSIACALYRKYMSNKEKYDMPLDQNRTSRDYLYGRALALADSLERWALREADEKRETNAARLMQRFSQRPYSTWLSIELSLSPYKARLGGRASKRLQMIDEVIASFDPEDFISDKPLSAEFLLGYHSQRDYLRSLRVEDGSESTETSMTEPTDSEDQEA